MRKITILTLMVVAVLSALVLMSESAKAIAVDPKVKICHKANAVNNPYQDIEVAQSSVDGGGDNGDHYSEHQGPLAVSEAVAQNLKDNKIEWGDIIPPIAGFHSGLNWTTEGQLIYNNGCKYVTGQGGNPDPETPVTPETPVVTPTASTISTLPYTGNGLLEVLSALGLSAAALAATYFASVKSFKFLNK